MPAEGSGFLARLAFELLRIRTRLLLVNVLIVAVPLLGIGFARFYEGEMLRSLEADMIHQAHLLRQVLLADPSGLRLAERRAVLAAAARDTRTRVRLLDEKGQLVADSHAQGPPEGREKEPPRLLSREDPTASAQRAHTPAPDYLNLATRREIRSALAGRYGSATRTWADGNRVFLFGALPIVREGPEKKVEGVIYVTRSTTPVLFAMHRLRSTLFKILVAAVLATAVLSLFLAGTISRPLARLGERAARIAAGERDVRLALDRRDEIGQLARAIDQMAGRLDARARYVGELAANISHEFKSPLTSLRGAAELLLDGAADDPVARERFLGNMLADARRLDRLVSRLLELSRLESDSAPVVAIDYAELVEECVSASSGPTPVKVEYQSAQRAIMGRRAHLASVLGNLLDNAQQHAAPGSMIMLRVEDGPRARIRTTVHNEGAPISEANLGRIWDRFFTTRAQQGGTGLGLPIVKSVVEAHGGRVSVESREGEGTAFAFELPPGATA